METGRLFVLMASKAEKQEDDGPGRARAQGPYVDWIREDEIRKQLYENERKAQENWERKWGFLRNSRRLWEEEATKRCLPLKVFDRKNNERKPPAWPEERELKVEFLPYERVPILSSEMIGWRSSAKENDLNRRMGPMYVSRKLTMDPPLSLDEPDLRYQKFIFLG